LRGGKATVSLLGAAAVLFQAGGPRGGEGSGRRFAKPRCQVPLKRGRGAGNTASGGAPFPPRFFHGGVGMKSASSGREVSAGLWGGGGGWFRGIAEKKKKGGVEIVGSIQSSGPGQGAGGVLKPHGCWWSGRESAGEGDSENRFEGWGQEGNQTSVGGGPIRGSARGRGQGPLRPVQNKTTAFGTAAFAGGNPTKLGKTMGQPQPRLLGPGDHPAGWAGGGRPGATGGPGEAGSGGARVFLPIPAHIYRAINHGWEWGIQGGRGRDLTESRLGPGRFGPRGRGAGGGQKTSQFSGKLGEAITRGIATARQAAISGGRVGRPVLWFSSGKGGGAGGRLGTSAAKGPPIELRSPGGAGRVFGFPLPGWGGWRPPPLAGRFPGQKAGLRSSRGGVVVGFFWGKGSVWGRFLEIRRLVFSRPAVWWGGGGLGGRFLRGPLC